MHFSQAAGPYYYLFGIEFLKDLGYHCTVFITFKIALKICWVTDSHPEICVSLQVGDMIC